MKKKAFAAIAAIFFAASCSDETTVFSDPSENISVEKSQSILDNSILFDDAGVLDIMSEETITGKTSKRPNDEAGDYPLTLIARVAPPSYSGGENLTASHVHVDGNYAYVSYNTVEDGYAGAIDIIDVGDPHNPSVSSRLYYTNADINSIEYNDGYLYAVGGVDSEKSVRATSNSFVVKIPAANGSMDVSAGLTYGFQEGFNATDVAVTSNTVFVTSGKDGLITSYKKSDLSVQTDASYTDLRSVAVNNGTVAILDASKGVSFLDLDLNPTKEIAIDSDFGNFSKRTIDIAGDHLVVSEGSKGAGVYDKSSGNLLEHVPILINPEGTAQSDIVTNAVATNVDVLLMANGGAGLCLSEDQGNNTDLVGIIDLNGSINYVESKGDYIFAASGKEGLQIVKLNRPVESLVTRCMGLSLYLGKKDLSVAEGETEAYQGAKFFNKITVDGSLLLCGSWTVNNSSSVNDNALFEMRGTLSIGRNNKRKNITVEKGATLRIEGVLNIYGDLILKEGATLEFIGIDSVVDIFGIVKKDANATVKGDFVDLQNKF